MFIQRKNVTQSQNLCIRSHHKPPVLHLLYRCSRSLLIRSSEKDGSQICCWHHVHTYVSRYFPPSTALAVGICMRILMHIRVALFRSKGGPIIDLSGRLLCMSISNHACLITNCDPQLHLSPCLFTWKKRCFWWCDGRDAAPPDSFFRREVPMSRIHVTRTASGIEMAEDWGTPKRGDAYGQGSDDDKYAALFSTGSGLLECDHEVLLRRGTLDDEHPDGTSKSQLPSTASSNGSCPTICWSSSSASGGPPRFSRHIFATSVVMKSNDFAEKGMWTRLYQYLYHRVCVYLCIYPCFFITDPHLLYVSPGVAIFR